MLTTLLAVASLSFTPIDESIEWFGGSYEEAQTAAAEQHKLLLTYFWANTPSCQQLYSQTMDNEAVVAQMNGMICYSANVTEAAPRAIFDAYGLSTIPALMVTDDEGQELEVMTGFMGAGTFTNEFNRIHNGVNTIPDLRERMQGGFASLDAELALRKMLADKLALIGQTDESERMLEAISARDPKNRTYTVAMLRFNELASGISAEIEDPSQWGLSSLEKFIKTLPKKNKRARFDSAVQLAFMQLSGERTGAAHKRFLSAWKDRPADYTAIPSSSRILNQLVNSEQELTPKQQKFARTLANNNLAILERDHAAHCDREGCDGSNRLCDNYARDEAAVTAGLQSGRFVTGRATLRRASIEFQVAQAEHLNGNDDRAAEILNMLIQENPMNLSFQASLERVLHPDEAQEDAGEDTLAKRD